MDDPQHRPTDDAEFDGIMAVIRDVRAGKAPPLRNAPYRLGACKHMETEVDLQGRTVKCTACFAVLDALTVLDQLARELDWTWVFKQRRDAEKELAALQEEVRKMRAARNALRRKGTP